MPTQSFNIALALSLVMASSVSTADSMDFLDRSKQIAKEAESGAIPAWLNRAPSPLDAAFQRILKSGNGSSAPAAAIGGDENNPGPSPSREVGKWLFVSFSMPEREFMEALAYAADENATVVLRGIDAGSDLGSFIKKVKGFGKQLKKLPNTLLDPILYQISPRNFCLSNCLLLRTMSPAWVSSAPNPVLPNS